MKKETTLISAFPGVGKTYLKDNFKNLEIIDSDSSTFDKENFPQNYIQHIKNNMGKVDVILISSHEAVRNALVEEGLPFILVYPDSELKNEYKQRYKERGSSEDFIKILDENWDTWMNQMKNQKGCAHIVLYSGQYLSNLFK